MTSRRPAGRATDREVSVVVAVLEAGFEKAAASHLDRQAPPRERSIQGRRGDNGAARVNTGLPSARAQSGR